MLFCMLSVHNYSHCPLAQSTPDHHPINPLAHLSHLRVAGLSDMSARPYPALFPRRPHIAIHRSCESAIPLVLPGGITGCTMQTSARPKRSASGRSTPTGFRCVSTGRVADVLSIARVRVADANVGHLREGREERYPYDRQEEVPCACCKLDHMGNYAWHARSQLTHAGPHGRTVRLRDPVRSAPIVYACGAHTDASGRKRIKLAPEKAIFIFVDDILPPTAALMSSIYDEHK